jgi:hypothetical protein
MSIDDYGGDGPDTTQVDYLSSLPQELIEEIGLMSCMFPYFGETTELFHAERHRVRTLYALCLVSKQLNQIFTRPLYTEPFIIDTQHARTLRYQNSAMAWLSPSCHANAADAKRFTLWRPQSEEMKKGYLCPINPFVMLFMLTNLRELTFAGNFKNRPPKDGQRSAKQWTEATLVPQYVPHLTSVRLIDVDDPELINILLIGVAHQITSMVICPAAKGTLDSYSPRAVYSSMRQTIEKLSSLTSFSVSLPGLKGAINHCNHAHKLIQKSIVNLPNKENVSALSISLPPFDCRSVQWADQSDSEDDDPKSVDHAWFWMTLQSVLSEFTNLDTFSFTGSSIPDEIRQKLQSCCLGTTMSFHKADKVQILPITTHTTHTPPPSLPTIPFAVPAPIPPQTPTTPSYQSHFPLNAGVITEPTQQLYPPIHASTAPWLSTYNPYYPPSPAAAHANSLNNPQSTMYNPFRPQGHHVSYMEPREQRDPTPIPDRGDTMDLYTQNEEWDWFIKYD